MVLCQLELPATSLNCTTSILKICASKWNQESYADSGGGLPVAGFHNPSLNHAGYVITTSGVFSFSNSVITSRENLGASTSKPLTTEIQS